MEISISLQSTAFSLYCELGANLTILLELLVCYESILDLPRTRKGHIILGNTKELNLVVFIIRHNQFIIQMML